MPHAGDTRTIRFLFLPTEHDPDSYVREHGTEAFERAVAQAVPLSRQLVEAARDGMDLDRAEGRANAIQSSRFFVAPTSGIVPSTAETPSAIQSRK